MSTVIHSPASATLGTLRIGISRARIEILQFAREKDAMLFTFALPIGIYCLFAVTMTSDLVLGGETIPHQRYMLPGMAAAGVMLCSFQSTAISLAADRGNGTLKRLRTTPMPSAAFLIGKCTLVLVTAAVQAGILIVVASLAFDVPGPTSWSRFAWVFALGCGTGTAAGVAFSALLRNPRSAPSVVAGTTLLLQFVCGVFFIFSQLPQWLQDFAQRLPLTWLARGMRASFLPESLATAETGGSWQLPLTALILAAWGALSLVIAVRTFRWTGR